jgi:hypothetical protein
MSDAASSSTPNLTRVLCLVRCIIDFGRSLADNFRQGTITGFDFSFRAGLFGTTDIPQILLRIARGLRRAAALEALLLARAQRGRDLKTAPLRTCVPRLPSIGLDPSASPRPRIEPLPLEPSDEEIAADVRGRPVGAVIVDICLDLGLLPGELGRDMHKELHHTLMFYGGSLIRLLRVDEHTRRAKEHIEILRSGAPLPPELQPFSIPFAKMAELAVATGPP